jgi:hypothetical protein
MAARMTLFTAALMLSAPLAAATLPDPTALPKVMTRPSAEAATSEPILDWVKVNGRHSIAWYGGSVVKLGDTLEDGRVSAIHEDHIVISSKSGRRSVYLLDRSIRTQPLTRPRSTR